MFGCCLLFIQISYYKSGNFHAEHGLADKWYPHQESIRVPLIIKDPRMSPEYKGTTNDEFTLNIDLATTILAAAGLEPLPSMMGRDMSDLYRNGGLKQAAATSQSRRKAFSPTDIRQRQYPDPASDGPEKYHSGSETSWRTEFFYERTFFLLFYILIIFIIHSPHLTFDFVKKIPCIQTLVSSLLLRRLFGKITSISTGPTLSMSSYST